MNNDLPSGIYSTKPRIMRDYERLKEKNLKVLKLFQSNENLKLKNKLDEDDQDQDQDNSKVPASYLKNKQD